MMPLLDTSAKQIEERGRALGCETYGQLLTPLTRYATWPGVFSIDNGAYSGFDCDAFLSLLDRELPNRERCLFVCAPDVVGHGRRTLEVFRRWASRLRGWPLALVAQDGVEELDIPWESFRALFIGGTTAWKLSGSVEGLIRAAQILGKWVHVGRVNTPGRWERFADLGVDSCDGTGLSIPHLTSRNGIRNINTHPHLEFGEEFHNRFHDKEKR